MLGKGGMGEVYLAYDEQLDRRIAIKVLPQDMARDPEHVARFIREAKAIAALNHPNIVTIHTVEEADGLHFLTMELIEGESLQKQITLAGLPLKEVLRIGIDLADALAAAHENGIVHRDVKPSNLMTAVDGRVKVLDFGLAKPLSLPFEAPASSNAATVDTMPWQKTLTTPGLVIGTVPYMSPEQVCGGPVDHRTDIYSMGVVLYEMIAGDHPFQGESQAEIISSILRDDPPPIKGRTDLPPPMSEVVNRCMEKNPQDRFQSAGEVSLELRRLLKELDFQEQRETEGISKNRILRLFGRSKWRGSPLRLAAFAGSLLILAVVLWLILAPRSPRYDAKAPIAEDTHSIAVLPFVNMSSDKEQEYFSDGLTEELLNYLTHIPDLKVAGRTSSFMFKNKNEDVRSIGKKLHVANILEGSVRKSGNTLRITAQLLKAEDGFHLWSQTYDRTVDDIFAIQDEIAGSVTKELQAKFFSAGGRISAPNTKAYDLLLQARFVLQNRTAQNVQRARKMIEEALVLSPSYAPAWAEMGLVNVRESALAVTLEGTRESLLRAKEALTKALELDPESPVALSRLANVEQSLWEFAESQRTIERALKTSTKNAIVMGNAALIFLYLGKVNESIALLEKCLEVEPLSLNVYSNLANAYFIAGRVREGEKLLRKALEIEPNHGSSHLMLGNIHLLRGEVKKAEMEYSLYDKLIGGGEFSRLSSDAILRYATGDTATAEALTVEFEKKFGTDNPSACAEIRAFQGNPDAAFAWLQKALIERDPALPAIKVDFYMRSLHRDPRWKILLEKIGLPAD